MILAVLQVLMAVIIVAALPFTGGKSAGMLCAWTVGQRMEQAGVSVLKISWDSIVKLMPTKPYSISTDLADIHQDSKDSEPTKSRVQKKWT